MATRNVFLSLFFALPAAIGCHTDKPLTPTTLDGMLAAGKYHNISKNLTAEHFEVDSSRFSTEGLSLLRIADDTYMVDVRNMIREIGVPANIEQLFAYGAAQPEQMRGGCIVAIGSEWMDPEGYAQMPSLYEDDNGRRTAHLVIDFPRSPWYRDFKFLVYTPQ